MARHDAGDVPGLAATVLFGAAYLLVALTGRFQAETSVTAALRERGEQVEAVLATPMPFNTLLWRVIAKTGDGAYYEAVSGRFDRQPPEMARLPCTLTSARRWPASRCMSACAGSPTIGCATTPWAMRWWLPTCAWESPATTRSVS